MTKRFLCLGIESTAHTFGVAVVDDAGKVYSNSKKSFVTEKGGMIPAQVADFHSEICGEVTKAALKDAKKTMKDISLIAYSASPGVGHSLRIGAMAARVLSKKYNLPLVGVNHCIAHLEIGRVLTKAKDPVLLYASGANTQVIAYEAGKYRIFGETLDIGVGNFLDVFAREMGLGFPGGPKIYELATKKKNNKYIELPYTVKGMDISLGGLLTNLKHKIKSKKHSKTDLAYSAQETAFAMLVEISERALAHCDKKELLLGGGVACNVRLQEMCQKMCDSHGFKLFVPENQFLVDNAAMIAWQGILEYKSGKTTTIEKAGIDPYERTDDVRVTWRI